MKPNIPIIKLFSSLVFLLISVSLSADSTNPDFETIKQNSIAINFAESIEYQGASAGSNYYFSFDLTSDDIPDSNTIYVEITRNYAGISCYTEAGFLMNNNGGSTDFQAYRTVYYAFLTPGKKYCAIIELKNDGHFILGVGQKGGASINTTTIGNVVKPVAPQLNVNSNGVNVSLSWSESENTDEYILYYASYPYQGADTIGQISMGNHLTFSTQLWSGAAFYIAIVAKNSAGSSEYSNIELLSID